MKQFVVLIVALIVLITAIPVLGQGNETITLNDVTPSISASVTLPPDSTGVVAIDLSMASVIVTDSSGNVVFQMADSRVHNIELSLSPNIGTHMINVERLPVAQEALVAIHSLPDLTSPGLAPFVETNTLMLNQQRALQLTPSTPGTDVDFTIPLNTTGVVTATYLGGEVTSQVVDTQGKVVATSSGSGIDGLNLVLDSGYYALTLLGNHLTNDLTAGVRLMSKPESLFSILQTPAPNQVVTTDSNQSAPPVCTATIVNASVNLRSGPGTGYSVLGFGYFNESMTVGGTNPEQNWIVVGRADGSSAWLAKELTQLNGLCSGLTVFNIPLRNAPPAQIIVQAPPTVSGGSSNSSFSQHDSDDDHGEYEEHDEHDD